MSDALQRPAIRPQLSFWQIWNMCFGFLGIQFGFALQNANMSRIFQTLGAEMDELAVLWIAAPLTGLIVQPIVGHYSDRTWTRLGRRRPYFLWGAVCTSLALVFMPNAGALWIAAGLLWILDASINVSMEPFRAFVGDQLPPNQRPRGYAMQSFFIGIGAVVASMLPFLLEKAGVANTAGPGEIPDTVRWAFYAGAVVLFLAVGWTVLSTREYPPDQLEAFERARPLAEPVRAAASVGWGEPLAWIGIGVAAAFGVQWLEAWREASHKELYVLAGLAVGYGLFLAWVASRRAPELLDSIVGDLRAMPGTMRRLAVVQFFSWFALFAMWLYTTAAVTAVHYGTTDTTSEAYNSGANWVGVLFAAYNGFAALAAIVIPPLARAIGLRLTHLVNLWLGALALVSFQWISDPDWLLLPMVGVGFAWASILSIPYALLCDALPAKKMGVYMGIFNFFIVIPQLVAVGSMGFVLEAFLGGQPILMLALGGASFVIAGLAVLRVAEPVADAVQSRA
ncbi:MAG: MFS transporter [Pseudomonadota bacterium]|jgi:maltose/moltooligosaccharide transporter